MKKVLNILFCGDSAAGGAANYLLGVLPSLPAKLTHLPPAKKLTLAHLKKDFDVIIFSDYSYDQLSKTVEKKVDALVRGGVGLIMVGGWGSFSGPFGKWRGSLIEKLLPVKCSAKDDRINFSSGAHFSLATQHPVIKGVQVKNSPVICGLNDVKVKKQATVVLNAREIVTVGSHLTLDPVLHPLLVVNNDPKTRTAAFACDFAPHWCGGLVDWGTKRKKLTVKPGMQIEVSDQYILLIKQIMFWLARKI